MPNYRVRRERKHEQAWEPCNENQRPREDYVPRRTFPRPAHVAILIDRHVVSAGEAFVLEAMRHAKVETFGMNTSGTIDYQNVMMTYVGAGRYRFALGYPLIAASDELPEGGLNKAGIPPDVVIDAKVEDWVGFVRAHYAKRK